MPTNLKGIGAFFTAMFRLQEETTLEQGVTLGVPDVLIWQKNALTLYVLLGKIYQEVSYSQLFPELDFRLLAQYLKFEAKLNFECFFQGLHV